MKHYTNPLFSPHNIRGYPDTIGNGMLTRLGLPAAVCKSKVPLIDIFETEETYEIVADVPGASNVNLELVESGVEPHLKLDVEYKKGINSDKVLSVFLNERTSNTEGSRKIYLTSNYMHIDQIRSTIVDGQVLISVPKKTAPEEPVSRKLL